MKTPDEIHLRISELNEQLLIIKTAQDRELNKPFKETDYHLLRFLHKEYDVYSFSLSQLEWLLSE